MKRSTILECTLFGAIVMAASFWVIYRDDADAPRAEVSERVGADKAQPSSTTHTPSPRPVAVADPTPEAAPRPKMTWSAHPAHKEARAGFENWVRQYNITLEQREAAMDAILDARDNYERGYKAFVEDASDVTFEMAQGKPRMVDPSFTQEDFIRLRTGEQGREELYNRILEIAGEDAAKGFIGHVGVFAGFFLDEPFVPVIE